MRFCGECKLNVYNLSGMSRQEAEDLVAGAEGRLCVRFYRRIDGTIITENCPVGWAMVKQRAKVYVTAAFSLLMTLLSGLFIASLFGRSNNIVEVGVLSVKPTPTPTPKTVPLMGIVPYTPPSPTSKQSSFSETKGEVLRVDQD